MGWLPLRKGHLTCQSGECTFPPMREATTMKATKSGIDVAKEVFKVHRVDEHGMRLFNKRPKRS